MAKLTTTTEKTDTKKIDALTKELAELKRDLAAETKRVNEKEAKVAKLKKELETSEKDVVRLKKELADMSIVSDGVVYQGKRYEILAVDTAKEVKDQMQKRFIDEDQSVVVINRHGS